MATVSSDIFKPTKFGGKYTITLIPGKIACILMFSEACAKPSVGDGIGAEVADSVKTIFKHENVPVEWEQVNVTGVVTEKKYSEDLFRESVLSLRRNKVG